MNNELTTTTANSILMLTDDNADISKHKSNSSNNLMLTTTIKPQLTVVNRMKPSKNTYKIILKELARLASIHDYANIAYISDYDDFLLEANEYDGCGLNIGGIANRSNTIILNANPSNTMMIDKIARIVSMIHNTCTGTHVLLNTLPDNQVNTTANIDSSDSIKNSLAWINADGFTNIDLNMLTC